MNGQLRPLTARASLAPDASPGSTRSTAALATSRARQQSSGRLYPFSGDDVLLDPGADAPTEWEFVLDQIRTVDRRRLVKRLATIGDGTGREVTEVLSQMYRP